MTSKTLPGGEATSGMAFNPDDPESYTEPSKKPSGSFDVVTRKPRTDGNVDELSNTVSGRLKRTPTAKFWSNIAKEAATEVHDITGDEWDRQERERRENFRPYAWVINASIDDDLEIYGENAPSGYAQSAVMHQRTGGRWWVTEVDKREEYTLLLLE